MIPLISIVCTPNYDTHKMSDFFPLKVLLVDTICLTENASQTNLDKTNPYVPYMDIL